MAATYAISIAAARADRDESCDRRDAMARDQPAAVHPLERVLDEPDAGPVGRARRSRRGAVLVPGRAAPATMSLMRLLVSGPREWTDERAVAGVLERYADGRDVELLHGDAPGVDAIAARIGENHGWTVRAFPPDVARHGARARPMRNLAMLDERPDLVIAFHDGRSAGTQHAIDEARRRGIPVEVHGSELDANRW